jgi:hypothetical protein
MLDIYLENGKKRTFAGALEWPGWCRGARDEDGAVATLLEYAPRYAAVVQRAGLRLNTTNLTPRVVERVPGDASTDFGAPGAAPSMDDAPVKPADLKRFHAVLGGCWEAFDAAARAAGGKELARGPRGGGRDLDRIVDHVLGADQGYLTRVGVKFSRAPEEDLQAAVLRSRQVMREALEAAARGEVPTTGPRGGTRWSARYFVRRVAWHVLDHAWEIQDRTP